MPPTCATAGLVKAAPSNSTGDTSDKYVVSSGMDERARVLEILRSDCRGGPKGECAYRIGRIVTGILRKCACTEHEQVGHIPTLQISVHRAVAGIVAHDGAAVEMRGLIHSNIVRPFAGLLDKLPGAHF